MGTTTTSQLKVHTHPTKPKRRRCKETTVSSSSAATPESTCDGAESTSRPFSRGKLEQSTPFSLGKYAVPQRSSRQRSPNDPDPVSSSGSSHSSSFRIRLSPGSLSTVMDFTAANGHPSRFTKFNSALTAGLLNPMSPPPALPVPQTRSSPTLFEMMANEPDVQQIRSPVHITQSNGGSPAHKTAAHVVVSAQDKQALAMRRISDLLAIRSPGNQFNDRDSSDISLTLSSKDGISISVNVHRQILVVHSRFFAAKLSDWRAKQQTPPSLPYIVEIADCDDVDVYIETLSLMYCKDLRKKLMREDVPRVLGILKVSAAIGFDAGVLCCLEYLEAAPWAEDEDEKVASLLSELRLENLGADEVLKRVSREFPNTNQENNNNGNCSSDNEQVLLKLLHVVLEGKDEKARRDMKTLISKMLCENFSQDDLCKETLYSACEHCLKSLKRNFVRAASGNSEEAGQIARQADNLNWVLDILIDRQNADDFLATWASQTEMSGVHQNIAAVHRYEVSRVTARLFVGIGKGQLLAPKEVRCLLLKTWLEPFYDDFRWMRQASRGLDRYLIEESLSNTVLTLPLDCQREIFVGWFDRFLNSGGDCPNLKRGFEVWWRRAFRTKNGNQKQPKELRITATNLQNS